MTDNKTDHMEAEARESTRFIKENKEWINRILNDTQINARVGESQTSITRNSSFRTTKNIY